MHAYLRKACARNVEKQPFFGVNAIDSSLDEMLKTKAKRIKNLWR